MSRTVRVAKSVHESGIVPAFWLTAQIVGTDRMMKPMGQEVITQFRVDTGADLTSISRDVFKELKAETSERKVEIRHANGQYDSPPVVYASLIIGGVSYTPHRGIIVTRSSNNFLGMDILDRFDMLVVDGIMHLEPNDQPEVNCGEK